MLEPIIFFIENQWYKYIVQLLKLGVIKIRASKHYAYLTTLIMLVSIYLVIFHSPEPVWEILLYLATGSFFVIIGNFVVLTTKYRSSSFLFAVMFFLTNLYLITELLPSNFTSLLSSLIIIALPKLIFIFFHRFNLFQPSRLYKKFLIIFLCLTFIELLFLIIYPSISYLLIIADLILCIFFCFLLQRNEVTLPNSTIKKDRKLVAKSLLLAFLPFILAFTLLLEFLPYFVRISTILFFVIIPITISFVLIRRNAIKLDKKVALINFIYLASMIAFFIVVKRFVYDYSLREFLLFLMMTLIVVYFADIRQSVIRELKSKPVDKNYLQTVEKMYKDFSLFIHDEVLQNILALKKLTESLSTKDKETKELLLATFDDLNHLFRDKINQLYPATIEELGILQNLSMLCSKLDSNSGPSVLFNADQSREMYLPRSYKFHVYRITRELITNAIKHAEASKIDTDIWFENGELVLTVIDDGIGIKNASVDDADKSTHVGLPSIYQEIRSLNGRIIFSDNNPKGTQIKVRIPIKETEKDLY